MSTKKLGRVMWTGNKEGSPIVICLDEPPRNCRPGRKLLLIDLSDPAALVEKVAKAIRKQYCTSYNKRIKKIPLVSYFPYAHVTLRALCVPSKLLKERKKK